MLQFIASNWTEWVSGGFGYGVISFAIRTAPIPKNVYGKWILGIIQFVFLNVSQGQDHFK